MPAKSHMGNPDVGRSVVAGPLRGSVRVGARLEQTGFLLGGCVEDMGRRVVSAVTVSGAWADCGLFTKTIEDVAPCVLVQEGKRRGRSKDVRVRSASQSKRSDLGPSTSQGSCSRT